MVQHKQTESNNKILHNSDSAQAKRKALKDLIIIGGVILFSWYFTAYVLSPIIPSWAITYIKIAEILIIGYFFVEIVSNLVFRLTSAYFGDAAHSIKIFIRIASAIVIAAIIISYLSKDPLVAASITTITGLVIGFASQSLIGNLIAGLYLASTRPFKVGDNITVFGNTGLIYEIGLLYSRLLSDTGDIIIASNNSLVSATIKINKKEI
ncbi:MAG: mechanosensitive ion channel domain-containing protein [Ignavibacteriales bacterium]